MKHFPGGGSCEPTYLQQKNIHEKLGKKITPR
jgi:hypothetical protein